MLESRIVAEQSEESRRGAGRKGREGGVQGVWAGGNGGLRFGGEWRGSVAAEQGRELEDGEKDTHVCLLDMRGRGFEAGAATDAAIRSAMCTTSPPRTHNLLPTLPSDMPNAGDVQTDQADIVALLSDARAYGLPADVRVEVIETHSAR